MPAAAAEAAVAGRYCACLPYVHVCSGGDGRQTGVRPSGRTPASAGRRGGDLVEKAWFFVFLETAVFLSRRRRRARITAAAAATTTNNNNNILTRTCPMMRKEKNNRENIITQHDVVFGTRVKLISVARWLGGGDVPTAASSRYSATCTLYTYSVLYTYCLPTHRSADDVTIVYRHYFKDDGDATFRRRV